MFVGVAADIPHSIARPFALEAQTRKNCCKQSPRLPYLHTAAGLGARSSPSTRDSSKTFEASAISTVDRIRCYCEHSLTAAIRPHHCAMRIGGPLARAARQLPMSLTTGKRLRYPEGVAHEGLAPPAAPHLACRGRHKLRTARGRPPSISQSTLNGTARCRDQESR